MGGPVYQLGSISVTTRFIGGRVYLGTPQITRALRGTGGHAVARAVVMHELGHLVGLQHVSNKRQLMAPTLHRGITDSPAVTSRACGCSAPVAAPTRRSSGPPGGRWWRDRGASSPQRRLLWRARATG
ncbi:matrixin family metalloprotease [Pedococcus sp. 5OH_020]|uniref:matrixin family metalloprotease n=1 Tax=Pedococcus sp. 5OH_020 TaxID=2989814 RepID=UPI003FA71958